jgi:hypothetical protein
VAKHFERRHQVQDNLMSGFIEFVFRKNPNLNLVDFDRLLEPLDYCFEVALTG